MVRGASLTVLLSAAAALSAVAPADDPPAAATARPPVAAGSAHSVQAAEPAAAPEVGSPVAAGAPGAPAAAPPAAAVRTMSLDEPIQGGLTARQAQAVSARLVASHREAGVAPVRTTWTPAMGRTALARARSWLGMPYAWAGGGVSGPTPGRCEPGQGADLDCRFVGFDCSG